MAYKYAGAEEKVIEISRSLITETNRRNRRRRYGGYAVFVAVFLLSQLVVASINLFSGKLAILLSAAGVLLASIVQFIGPVRQTFLGDRIVRKYWETLNQVGHSFSMYDLENRVSYSAGNFDLAPSPVQIEQDSELGSGSARANTPTSLFG